MPSTTSSLLQIVHTVICISTIAHFAIASNQMTSLLLYRKNEPHNCDSLLSEETVLTYFGDDVESY